MPSDTQGWVRSSSRHTCKEASAKARRPVSACRYAEAHECTFNYKKMERQRLAKNNPLVQASKVDKL